MENQIPPVTNTSEIPPVPQPQVTGIPVNTPPPPKKVFPKKIFIILGAIIGVIILGFVILNLMGSKVINPQTTITWWGMWEDQTIVAPIIAEYESKNPKVKINYIKQSHQDYRERLTNAFAKGTGPDIFRFHNTWVPMFRGELDTLPASVMSASEFATTFYPIATSDLTSGTGLVGIPLMYDGLGLYINEEIFAKEGKTPPVTWDDLRTLAIELTQKDDQDLITRSGIAMGRTENVDHWQEILALLMIQNGVNLSNPTGKLAEDALNYFTIFSRVDGVWDSAMPPSTIAFAAGKTAMYLGPSWRAFEIREQNPNLKFRVVKVPQVAKQNPSEPDTAYATYWVEGVWSRSKNKEESWKFVKFLSETDTLQKLYLSAAKTRPFGEAYPRVEMQETLKDDPVLGGIISTAGDAQSWYLASRTFDGNTGINSLISKYFEDAINSVNTNNPASKALETVAQGVSQVLSQYGLSTGQ
jgi:multiple sugar transport system substrate-binding protein